MMRVGVKIRRVVTVGFKALCNTSEEGARESKRKIWYEYMLSVSGQGIQ